MEKVSVIVPIYNQEKYLQRSLDSIVKQTWENLDIVLINDGSTDNSLDIISSYQAVDKRIKIVCQENQGLVGAVISGIINSDGIYTCFVDPDDFIGEEYIERFMREIEDYEFIAMGYHSKSKGFWVDNLLLRDEIYNKDDLLKKSKTLFNEFDMLDFGVRFGVSRCNKLYKTELLRRIISDYAKCKASSLGEDSIFTFLVLNHASNCKTLKCANEYFYDTGSNNSMSLNVDACGFLDKVEITKHCFSELLHYYASPAEQADYLFFLLCNNLLNRLKAYKDYSEYSKAYKALHNNEVYMQVLEHNKDSSKRERIKSILWKKLKSARVYLLLVRVLDLLIKLKHFFNDK